MVTAFYADTRICHFSFSKSQPQVMGAPLQLSVTERHRLGRAGRAGRSGVRGPSGARRPPPARRLRCSRDAVTGASLGRPQTYFLNDAASQHPSETLPGREPPSPARGEEARVADAGRRPGCTRRPWPPRCGRCGRGAAAVSTCRGRAFRDPQRPVLPVPFGRQRPVNEPSSPLVLCPRSRRACHPAARSRCVSA